MYQVAITVNTSEIIGHKKRKNFRNKKVTAYQVMRWDRPFHLVIRPNIIFISTCYVETVSLNITIVPVPKTYNVCDR